MTIKTDKRKRRAARTLVKLVEFYPNTFSLTDRVRPLKLGIGNDLYADLERTGLARSAISQCLFYYVRNPAYVASIVDCVFRIDLDGKAAGKVSEQEKNHAAATLAKIAEKRAKWQKRKGQCRVETAA